MLKRVPAIAASLLIFCSANAAVVSGDYLGTFSGNDSEGAILAAIGVEVTQLARVDTPATSNDGLMVGNLIFNADNEPASGEWSYSGPGIVDYIVIKAGNAFAVYLYTDLNTTNMRNMGIWDTGDVDNSGMSHITAYTTNAVPLPAALWLFGSGLLGLGLVSRRK